MRARLRTDVATCAAVAAVAVGLSLGAAPPAAPAGAVLDSSAPVSGPVADSTAPRPAAARRAPTLGVGVQFHGLWSDYNDAQRVAVLDRLVAMGATWVRIDMSWAMLQPRDAPIDATSWGVRHTNRSIAMAHARGLKVLGTLWLTPDWANHGRGERSGPTRPRDYATALAWAAKHWDGEVQAWEVWNEPNSSDFYTEANPVSYTRLLCAGARAVRASGARTRIVFGGTMYNDTSWISRSYRAGAKGCFDIMATHPYTAPSDAGPRDKADGVYAFSGLRRVRQVMTNHGDASPVWITEFGWSSHANTGNEQPWNRGVTTQEQARFTVGALDELTQRFRWVRKAFVYCDRTRPENGRMQAGYGILRRDLTPKPVYTAMRTWLRRR